MRLPWSAWVCALAILLVAVSLCVQREVMWHLNKRRAWNISRTWRGIYKLAELIQRHGHNGIHTVEELLPLLDTDDILHLAIAAGDKNVLSGVYRDAWGMPVLLVRQSEEQWQLVSFGPNRRDDNGEGDDIVYGFRAPSKQRHEASHNTQGGT